MHEQSVPFMTVSVPLLHDVHARIDLTATYDREDDAITVHVVDDHRVQLLERSDGCGSLVKRAIAAEHDASASRSAAGRLSGEVTRMRRAEVEREAREYALTWCERWDVT